MGRKKRPELVKIKLRVVGYELRVSFKFSKSWLSAPGRRVYAGSDGNFYFAGLDGSDFTYELGASVLEVCYGPVIKLTPQQVAAELGPDVLCELLNALFGDAGFVSSDNSFPWVAILQGLDPARVATLATAHHGVTRYMTKEALSLYRELHPELAESSYLL